MRRTRHSCTFVPYNQTSTWRMGKINVLLVEDDLINQTVARSFLCKWGMNVVVAQHGLEALSSIRSQEFDVVLMDLQMPVMDGFECTTRIRSLPDTYFKTVPIIAFSASSLIDSRQKAIHYGMNDFTSKPIRCEELYDKITRYTMKDASGDRAMRPLFIDFDLYTDGDAAFKLEFTQLMIDNLQELQQSIQQSLRSKNGELFSLKYHKVAATIEMLSDAELTEGLDILRDHFKGTLVLSPDSLQAKGEMLQGLLGMIMRSLALEIAA
jgi:CheY-like chemotaxis protein